MGTATLVRDAAVGVAAGVIGAKAMTPATSKFYELQTEQSKKKEQEASYGVAYNVAAEKTANTVGVDLDQQEKKKAGNFLHYALAVAWTPVYMWLRRSRGYKPFGAAVASATSMYVIVDEVANPLLGFTPPPRKYPLATHMRGLAGHLVYGLATGAAIEAAWRVFGGRPRRSKR